MCNSKNREMLFSEMHILNILGEGRGGPTAMGGGGVQNTLIQNTP